MIPFNMMDFLMRVSWMDLLDIIIVATVIYQVLLFLKGTQF